MKIAFHSNQLGERGTEIALYDYAYYNKTILGNDSVIISSKNSRLDSLSRFKKNFKVFLYNDFSEVDAFLQKENVDIFYTIKYGKDDGIVSKICKNAVHCVFFVSEPHGDVYAAISEEVAQKSNLTIPVVPHMINMPDINGDLRKELGIPKTALVFGRYGGADTFNIKFVHKVIKKIVHKRDDIYFLFMNTNLFYQSFFKKTHPQIIHLPSTIDLDRKVKFINTCDAKLHARKEGETFGLAVGEFSVKQKPVLTWSKGKDLQHINILQDKAIIYSNAKDLYNIIVNFDTYRSKHKEWDAYSKNYSPETIIKQFKKVFIDE